MASIKSITGMAVDMDESLKFLISDDLPASLSCFCMHKTEEFTFKLVSGEPRSQASVPPYLLVDPDNDLALDHGRRSSTIGRGEGAEHAERVRSHQLPHQCHGQCWIAFAQILAGNADQREFQLLAQLDGVVAVLQLFHERFELAECFVHSCPVDNTWLDDVEQLVEKWTNGMLNDDKLEYQSILGLYISSRCRT